MNKAGFFAKLEHNSGNLLLTRNYIKATKAILTIPNSENIDQGLKQYQLVTEFEKRHELWDQPGKLKLLVFANRGKMGRYSDAVAQSPSGPDLAKVRKLNWKAGIAVNLEQQLNSSLALFGRASINDGSKETYEFTDINQSLSLGLSIKGSLWNRPQDTLGAQIIVNGLSGQAKDYYAAGGLGLLVGDGYLKYDLEKIIEMYYGLQLMNHLALSFDLQNVTHPAYNILRGPVTIYAVRLHADF